MPYSCRKFNPNAEEMYKAFTRRMIEEGFAVAPDLHQRTDFRVSYPIEVDEERREPHPDERWMHKSNRHYYKIILLSNEGSVKTKFPTTVVYEDILHGGVWSSPLCRFLERFIHEDDIVSEC